jgi:hypothetical protein
MAHTSNMKATCGGGGGGGGGGDDDDDDDDKKNNIHHNYSAFLRDEENKNPKHKSVTNMFYQILSQNNLKT